MGALPVFIEWGDDMVYGLPVPEGAAHGGTYKVSPTRRALPSTPAASTRSIRRPSPTTPRCWRCSNGAVGRLLPCLHPEPVGTERCVYDNATDGDFVLDRVGNVVVGCGTSGHTFKFGPLLGEILADLADGTGAAPGLERFSLRREGGGAGDRLTPGRLPVPRYVALLRSVNVAGHGRIAMQQLRASFEALGYTGVTTYIQTGNVLFSTGSKSQAGGHVGHRGTIGGGLRRLAGGHRADRARTGPGVGTASPYAKAGADPGPRHHVTFLATAPPPAALAALALPPSGQQHELVVDGREVYVHTPDGYTATKFATGAFLERRLGVVSTTRNWNTVTKLCGLRGTLDEEDHTLPPHSA